jgi:2-polyprenyl-3-methyl-5-hydroxy-6-metoxy-1,4-benzoquinol methylase
MKTKQPCWDQHLFIVVKSSRLEFENSSLEVENFVKKRLEFYKVKFFEITENYNEAYKLIQDVVTDLASSLKYIVLIDIMSPLVDFDIIKLMTATLDRVQKNRCLCIGSVPGTGVNSMIHLDSVRLKRLIKSAEIDIDKLETVTVYSNTQSLYNNQLNLYKYKRLKLFLVLCSKVEKLFEKSIDECFQLLDDENIYRLMISFGEDVRLLEHKNCPHCKASLQPLLNTASQPMCGYVSSKKPHYLQCEACNLVVSSPYIHDEDIWKIYDKWDKQDFVVSTNNPYNSQSIRCDFNEIYPLLPPETVSLDLGGGIGNFSRFLRSNYPLWDITHSDFAIKAINDENIKSRVLDFTNDLIGYEQYNLITAWEVVEHIPFHKFSFVMDNIWRALKPGGFFVFSTPDFDSPLCRSLDFYSMGLPFHYTVLGQKWLTSYFQTRHEFEIFDIKHCSDFLDDALNWYTYAEKTSSTMALRGTYSLLKEIFKYDNDERLKRSLTKNGIGTEIIVTLRK